MGEICRRTDVSGEIAGVKCPECGHTNVAHHGVEACVVCELLALRDDLAALVTPPA